MDVVFIVKKTQSLSKDVGKRIRVAKRSILVRIPLDALLEFLYYKLTWRKRLDKTS